MRGIWDHNNDPKMSYAIVQDIFADFTIRFLGDDPFSSNVLRFAAVSKRPYTISDIVIYSADEMIASVGAVEPYGSFTFVIDASSIVDSV